MTDPVKPPPAAPVAQVPVADEYGNIGTAPADQVASVVAGGGRTVTPEEYRQAQLQAKHGGIGGTLAAAGEGAARGISLGLLDPLAVGAGHLFAGEKGAEAVREHLAEEKEAHPNVSTAGELAGAAAPILLSGGAGGAVRGGAAALGEASEAGTMAKLGQGIRTLGALPRGVSALGEGAEHAMAGILGSTAESTLGRAGQAAAKSAIRGIVEGGLFGAGQDISESTLQDQPLTAEKLFAAVGHGALMGGLLGAGTGAVGSLAGDAVRGALGASGERLGDAAADQAFASLDAKGANEAAIKRAGGRTEIGQTYLDEVLRPSVEEGGLRGAALTNDEKLALTNKVLKQTSDEVKERLSGTSADVSLDEVLKPFNDRIDEYSSKLGQTAVARRMEQLRDEAERILNPNGAAEARITIGDLYEAKQSLQKAAYQAARTMNPTEPVQQMREVTGEFNSLIESAMNKASKEAGEGLAGTELRDLNKKMQRLMVVQDILEHNSVRYARNDTVSLTAKMAGMGELAGAMASGHPLHALGAIPVMAATEAVKYHGNAYAALMLDRLAAMGGASAAVREVSESMDKAVDAAMKEAPARKMPRGFSTKAPDNDNRFAEEESRIRQLAAMAPALVGAHLEQRTGPLATHLPETAAAMQQSAKSATAYLASKLPPDPMTSTPSLTPQLQKTQATLAQKQALLHAVDAIEGGPGAIMQRIAQGKATPEDMEVLQKFYPASMAELRAKITQKAADRKTPLPYQQEIRLSQLFGMPMSPTRTNGFRLAIQESYAKHPQAPESSAPVRKSAPASLSVSRSLQSVFEPQSGRH